MVAGLGVPIFRVFTVIAGIVLVLLTFFSLINRSSKQYFS